MYRMELWNGVEAAQTYIMKPDRAGQGRAGLLSRENHERTQNSQMKPDHCVYCDSLAVTTRRVVIG